MLDIVFAMMAAGMNSTAPGPTPDGDAATDQSLAGASTVQIAPQSVIIGQGTVVEGGTKTPAPAATGSAPTQEFNMAVVPVSLVADPQTPSGKFTTAAEVKPILNATKGNWVAVRDYDGQDLLYVTHLWGWRCGLKAMAISVNGETMQNWPLPPCHEQFVTPNAILEEDGIPYLRMRQGAIQTITIQIVYDDLSMDAATFERGNVLIP